MLKLGCKEMDVDCDFVATGKTPQEVAKVALAHARSDHTDDVKGMTDAEIISMCEVKAHP